MPLERLFSCSLIQQHCVLEISCFALVSFLAVEESPKDPRELSSITEEFSAVEQNKALSPFSCPFFQAQPRQHVECRQLVDDADGADLSKNVVAFTTKGLLNIGLAIPSTNLFTPSWVKKM